MWRVANWKRPHQPRKLQCFNINGKEIFNPLRFSPKKGNMLPPVAAVLPAEKGNKTLVK
jgi:hypothetical protein